MAADIDIHDYFRDPTAFMGHDETHNAAFVTSLMEMDEQERQHSISHADWKTNSHLISMAIGLQRHDAVHFIVKHSSERRLVLSWMMDVAAHHENTQMMIAPYFSELEKEDVQKYLRRGAQWGDFAAVDFALSQGADPLYNDSEALKASLNYPEIVALLAPVSNVNADNGMAFGLTARRGFLKSFQELLPFVDHKHYIETLFIAASHGHNHIVDVLYPLCDREMIGRWVANGSVPLRDDLTYLHQLWSADHTKATLEAATQQGGLKKCKAIKL